VRTLVISRCEPVRRQLVAYLGRSPALAVSGQSFTPEAIRQARPDVLVLDLSRLDQPDLRATLDSARQVGARVIALASMREPADEALVVAAGGIYRLKVAGADGLAELVQQAAPRLAPAGRR
jgi:DNA-binding NarL/FixJ family response regulator